MPQSDFDPYAELGVPKDATAEQIKSAYRKLAMKHHPDRNPGDKASEERFKRVSSAHEILSDPARRSEHDARASNPFADGFRFHSGSRRSGGPDPFADMFGDVFSDVFSRRSSGLSVEASLSLSQAAFGAEVDIPYAASGPCPACNGSGLSAGRHCPSCRGSGSARSEAVFRARVPPGSRDGDSLRIPASGSFPGASLLLSVPPHPVFSLDGLDLRSELDVPLHAMILGGEAQALSLQGGSLSVKIPPGSKPGAFLRLRGQGFPRPGDPHSRGDLILRLRPTLPERLTAEQEAALRAFAKTLS